MRRDNVLPEDLADRDLHALCLRWAEWHREHGLLAPPIPKNILARYQPARIRAAPHIGLSPVLSTFNTAVNAQDDGPAKTAFLIFYLMPARSVKEAAAAQEISRDGFYRRVRRFRRRVYRTALSLEKSSTVARVLRSTLTAQS